MQDPTLAPKTFEQLKAEINAHNLIGWDSLQTYLKLHWTIGKLERLLVEINEPAGAIIEYFRGNRQTFEGLLERLPLPPTIASELRIRTPNFLTYSFYQAIIGISVGFGLGSALLGYWDLDRDKQLPSSMAILILTIFYTLFATHFTHQSQKVELKKLTHKAFILQLGNSLIQVLHEKWQERLESTVDMAMGLLTKVLPREIDINHICSPTELLTCYPGVTLLGYSVYNILSSSDDAELNVLKEIIIRNLGAIADACLEKNVIVEEAIPSTSMVEDWDLLRCHKNVSLENEAFKQWIKTTFCRLRQQEQQVGETQQITSLNMTFRQWLHSRKMFTIQSALLTIFGVLAGLMAITGFAEQVFSKQLGKLPENHVYQTVVMAIKLLVSGAISFPSLLYSRFCDKKRHKIVAEFHLQQDTAANHLVQLKSKQRIAQDIFILFSFISKKLPDEMRRNSEIYLINLLEQTDSPYNTNLKTYLADNKMSLWRNFETRIAPEMQETSGKNEVLETTPLLRHKQA